MNDQDLIAALAEGALDPAAAAEAEARISADPELSEELRLQRAALAALASAETPTLTDFERQRLHRAIAEERVTATPPVRPARAKTRRPWSLRLMPALAAALVLVVGIGLAGQLILTNTAGDGAADSSDAEAPVAAFELDEQQTAEAAPDTTAAASEATIAAPESAGASDMLAADAGDDDVVLSYVSVEDLVGDLRSLAQLNANALKIQALERSVPAETFDATAEAAEAGPCEPPPGEQLPVQIDGSDALVVFEADGTGWTVIELDTCAELADSDTAE